MTYLSNDLSQAMTWENLEDGFWELTSNGATGVFFASWRDFIQLEWGLLW
ncbi:MAG: hypothetical protein ACFE0J_24950 [Elainellaceae cyanobacterium]